MWLALFNLIIFPGLLFLFVLGLIAEVYDRKLYARLQNRVGPPWYQTIADFIKLAAKEDIVPQEADLLIFKLMPILAVVVTITALFYIPLWSQQAFYSFNGDLIVVLYLLTIPSLAFFLGGWYSRSVYSMIGAVRSLIQFFAYEVPLFVSILGPALLANTWSISEMTVFYKNHPYFWIFNLVGFGVSLVALLGKLEKVPFDIPEAETEMVAGTLTEYGGRRLAFLRMAINIEMLIAASLFSAVFLPWGLGLNPVLGFIVYLIKVFFVVSLVSLARTLFARLRIDQMVQLCWKVIAPIAFMQFLFNLVIKGVLLR